MSRRWPLRRARGRVSCGTRRRRTPTARESARSVARVGKPDASVFRHALSRLGADAKRAVMVGDSVSRDVDGALSAGLGAVWVNRFGRVRPAARPDLVEVSTLRELAVALGVAP
jgi:FMN phosphatase YigB (HAD superfamily)